MVLIPAFNDRPALDRTLASLAEDLHPFDALVVDDGSVPPLDVPAAAGTHQVVTLRLDVNGGIARALNAGVEWMLALGYDAVARLGAGDLNLPNRLARQAAFLVQHPDAALVGGWTRHVEAARSLTHANRLAMAWSRLRLQGQHFTWRRLDCWLGIGRSVALLAVPVWLRLTMKRIAGTVG